MKIRDIAPADREPLAEALTESFRSEEIAIAFELLDDALDGSEDYRARVAASVKGAPCGIGGYICYGPTPMTLSTFDLYWIVVHPRARGRGVAGALIADMESELRARGVTGVRVETSETEGYGAARRLYQRMEYPRVGFLEDFYRPGDGLVIYYKRL